MKKLFITVFTLILAISSNEIVHAQSSSLQAKLDSLERVAAEEAEAILNSAENKEAARIAAEKALKEKNDSIVAARKESLELRKQAEAENAELVKQKNDSIVAARAEAARIKAEEEEIFRAAVKAKNEEIKKAREEAAKKKK